MSIYQYFVKVCFHKNENILFILFCHLHILLKNASWTSFLIKTHRPHSFFFHSCITFCCWIIPVLRILGFKSFKLRLLFFFSYQPFVFAKLYLQNQIKTIVKKTFSLIFILYISFYCLTALALPKQYCMIVMRAVLLF